MKSFLDILKEEESQAKHHVMTFGRMNPPTTGHMKLIDKVHSVAAKNQASHSVVTSHSQDTKKNPLSAEQKVKHLKRYSPDTNFQASSKEKPTILHHASDLHKKGVTHLHVVVGSDRVKEMHHLLHTYNGKTGPHGHYNFKKITVHSAGHRDPDAEGTEGMSASKMREHAKNKNSAEFRKGVPSHVSDQHSKELMHDVRKGMGLHENVGRGLFKAIFVTGGPGSGKDIVIREAIAESKSVEMNFIQAFDYLADKQKLSQKSNDLRLEAIRNRMPLIINGPAEDMNRVSYIKEELEELGYETMMVFVDTTDSESRQRNERLTRMMVESVRHNKWMEAQKNKDNMYEMFDNFLFFDNNGAIDSLEEDITQTYLNINTFLESKNYNNTAFTWLERNNRLNIVPEYIKEQRDVKKVNRFIQIKTNPSLKAPGPADIVPDNKKIGTEIDSINGPLRPRKDPEGRGHSGGAWSGTYSTEETKPKLTKRSEPKETNFSQDKDKIKRKKFGDTSLSASRISRPSGVGQEYDTRAGGQGAAAGAGLGDQTYREEFVGQTTSNDDVSNFAGMPRGVSPNPLSNEYDSKKPFNKFRKKLKEYNGFQNDVEMGVGGTLGGASNKEGMDTYKDTNRNIGIIIKKKKKQEK